MALAMTVGMVALAPLWPPVAARLGVPELLARPDAHVLLMAADMTVGVVVWMRVRRHAQRAVAGMSAAMVLPFLVLLPPHWAGLLDGAALSAWGHVLVLAAMAALVALRPAGHGVGQR